MYGYVEEVKRILKPECLLAILEINKEKTQFGSPMEIIFSPKELENTIKLPPSKAISIGEYFFLKKFTT